jgi:hypothetical protein
MESTGEAGAMQAVRRFLTVALISVLGVLGVVASAAPAAARVIDHERRFHDFDSFVVEDFCGDLTVRVEFDVVGMFLENSHGRDGLVYFMETHHGFVSYTNLANGESVTVTFNDVDKDLKVTDNGDGTLTVLTSHNGVITVRASTGKVQLKETGTLRVELLIDAAGTPTDPSDDELIEERVVKEQTGLTLEGRDFCDDIHQFIG